MRYSSSHKEETRRKLLDSSRALLKKGGFYSTGVDKLMASIGLTSGAFYSHFKSKDELLEVVLKEEIDNTVRLLFVPDNAEMADMIKAINLYISKSHAENPDKGCVLPALGAEISRSSPKVKSIIENGMIRLQKIWSNILDKDEDLSWSILSQCIGSLVLARSIESEELRNKIIESNQRYIERVIAKKYSD